ncbi:hypothetical protein AAG906_004362 [Vitis piasezkii]
MGLGTGEKKPTRGSAKKEVKFGPKKLWTTLFPPSSGSLRRIVKSFQWRRLSGWELSGNEDSV